MKKLFVSLIAVLLYAQAPGQTWTSEQLNTANTAKDISFLSAAEKEAIQYINLARLYPKLFSSIELENYIGPAKYGDHLKNSPYKRSLASELNMMAASPALHFDTAAYANAKCFSKESGESGYVGHDRKTCPNGNYAECCSYGMDTGKDIAMQWLIDDKTESLGHRKNCLNKAYSKIGLSTHAHIRYGNCAVADLIW